MPVASIKHLLSRALLGALLFGSATADCVESPAFAVITAANSERGSLARADIEQIFLHRRNFWSDGTRIHPVNLPADHPLRELFSRTVLGGSPAQFENYWREMYFHGVLPPHVVASEEAMILFVRSVPGAIGYVANCIPAHDIDVVLMVGEVPRCPK
ncbi:MAG TPA: hypothetical protein VFM32_06555 [Spongiibacteraceae bacterium]|nr:hypothetical protein [Spongiibacteraceae bacterium]